MSHTDYERLRTAHLSAVQASLEDYVGRLEWSRERIERYRDHRLRALLSYACERSPFHARRLESLDPSSMTVADLATLPVMTKREAQDEWDTIVTLDDLSRADVERILTEQHGFSYTRGGQQVFSSGGSSGVRGVYVWDWQFFVSVASLAWRMQMREERRAPAPTSTCLAVLEAGVPPHASTPLFDVPTVAGMRTIVIPAGAPFGEVLAAVSAAQPTHLVGYPSVIGRLARASLAGELRILPLRVSTNSEPLLEEDLRVIREAWHAPIHNLWGSTEIGVQAVGCSVGEGLHVCEDEVVLECVDGRTLATSLANFTFPFIRYDLGDQVAFLPGACPCGSAFARVAEIGGRRDDDFYYGEKLVPASIFRHVLGTDPRVSEYQVKQTPAGAEILAVGTPDVDVLESSILTALRRYGLADAEIRIQLVDRIPRHHASGKLRRFIGLRPDPGSK